MNAVFFFQGIPETIGTIALSLAMARVSLRWIPIILAGAVISITGSVIRALPVALGLHTIAMLLLSVLFVAKTTRVSPAKGFITITASVVILIFLEMIIHLTIFNITRLDPQTIKPNSLIWALIGLPQALIMFVLALLTQKFKKPLPGGWKI